MRTRGMFDREKEERRVRAWYATLPWTSLVDRFPEPHAHVLLRLADERVVGARWDGEGWRSASPFEALGKPVAWAKFEQHGMSSNFDGR